MKGPDVDKPEDAGGGEEEEDPPPARGVMHRAQRAVGGERGRCP